MVAAELKYPDVQSFRNLRSKAGEPPLEIIEFLPSQGHWSEENYLTVLYERGVELVDGFVEVLPVPTPMHQDILGFIYSVLKSFVKPGGLGKVSLSGIRVRLRSGTFREPDIAFVGTKRSAVLGDKYWGGADLVMEIVSSPDGRTRDYVDKRADYAAAGIPEYWIVDPQEEQIMVLNLQGGAYIEHGIFKLGQSATSVVLEGFCVDVTAALAGE